MISIYKLKSKFQELLRPIVGGMARAGITANQVTIAAVFLSALNGAALIFFAHHSWPWLMLPLVLFIRMALNAIDGMLAREHDMKTPLGALLNELGDVVSDTALYLPFMAVSNGAPVLVALAVTLAVISEMAGVVSVQIGGTRRYDGPMGKSDRALAFGAIGLLIGLDISVGTWFFVAFAIINLLTLWTIANRVRSALTEIKKHG